MRLIINRFSSFLNMSDVEFYLDIIEIQNKREKYPDIRKRRILIRIKLVRKSCQMFGDKSQFKMKKHYIYLSKI